MVEAMC